MRASRRQASVLKARRKRSAYRALQRKRGTAERVQTHRTAFEPPAKLVSLSNSFGGRPV